MKYLILALALLVVIAGCVKTGVQASKHPPGSAASGIDNTTPEIPDIQEIENLTDELQGIPDLDLDI